MLFTHFFKAEISTVAIKLKVLPQTAQYFYLKNVNEVYWNHFGVSGLPETWIMPEKPYTDILCFSTVLI